MGQSSCDDDSKNGGTACGLESPYSVTKSLSMHKEKPLVGKDSDDDDALYSCSPPDICIRWILFYAIASNVELGVVSNVSRNWRNIAIEATEDSAQSIKFSKRNKQKINHVPGWTKENAEGTSQDKHHSLLSLLLPSMILELNRVAINQQDLKNNENISQLQNKEHITSPNRVIERGIESQCNEFETFCLSWFHPRGAVPISVRLNQYHGSEDIDDISMSFDQSRTQYQIDPIENELNPTYFGEKGSRSLTSEINGLKNSACSNTRPCVLEWRGYRSAMDVLIPFGYTANFVYRVLQPHLLKVRNLAQYRENVLEANVTYAVRGATVARADHPSFSISRMKDISEIIRSRKPLSSSGADDNTIEHDDAAETAKQLLLPRLVQRKMSDQDSQAKSIEDKKKRRVNYRGQRAVQFLNANGDRAVRMRTDAFACGAISQPVTIFCVAIANEDGVFVSGLKQRFQLGHLYPRNLGPIERLTELSNICISTDSSTAPRAWNKAENDVHDTDQVARMTVSDNLSALSLSETQFRRKVNGLTGTLQQQVHAIKLYQEAMSGIPCCTDYTTIGENDGMAPEESKNMSSIRPDNLNSEKANPLFVPSDDGTSAASSSYDDEDDDYVPSETEILRGKIGPGQWHMYTAVFDGENSIVRVDGRIESDEKTGDSTCNKDSNIGKETCGKGTLDGLTIGSDHKFDMSLCFGSGGDNEGEGAISELAVFRGNLSLCDINHIEKQWLQKYNIPRSEGELTWKEDEQKRLIHALLLQPDPWDMVQAKIPLKIAAQHPLVSWHKTNAVTGKKLEVARIGCRTSQESSDW
mmetsp:Transcript_20837/g.25552  ORF Transcript_20837/g.25552 Transcript_20837/m.25552 type:complete len:812 (-) Transcript_20837:887-3322(-)